ncbi:two-component regulator propeller domain-containing protein [Aquimarina sp. 2201CG5-10]|uniref:sensor histidine kinase n=1 Tax=Aquimarina callyspongiae TaxID=3098150 RepID=UPI002AB3A515|nr:two-component regulator propeller domain-containing protein [Aquimarina sp. 2201CG5-10]MDY8138453.1 two-component regulator propeller domain-containing protein [Aquimarina sp. 2201CG5-10]
MKWNFLYTLLLLSIYSGISQKPIYKHYTTEDGLPHDITYGIIQDSDGYIWIGTDDGLTRFNGIDFKNYTYEDGLLSNYVIDILEVKPKEYAIATWGGGLHTMKNDSITKQPIPNDETTKINILDHLKNGKIYANSKFPPFYTYDLKNNTKEVLYLKINHESNTPFLSVTPPLHNKDQYLVSESIIDKELYIHANEDVKELNGKEFPDLYGIYKVTKDSLSIAFDKLKNLKIHEAYKKDDFYYFTSFNTIFKYEYDKIVDQKKLEDIPNEKIIHLKKHKDNFYFITINRVNGSRKLYTYNWKNSTLLNISDQLHIESMISDFIFDSQNNLWITTYGEGVYILPTIGHSFLGDEIFSNPDLKDILFIEDNLYALSTNKLHTIDSSSKITEIDFPFHTESFRYDSINNVLTLNAYSTKKIFVNDTQNDQLKIIGDFISNNDIYYKNLHISNEFNVIKFYKDNILFASDNTIKSNMDEAIKKMVIHEDKLYIINRQIGVLVYDVFTGKLIQELSTRKGFSTNKVTDIVFDHSGSFWITTDRGVFNIESKKITQYTTKNGLISNHINNLFFDRFGVLWVGTQKGLSVLSNNQFYTIGKESGQQSSFITKVIEHKGFIYAAGNKGIFKYNNSAPFAPQNNSSLQIKQKRHSFFLTPINYVNGNSMQWQYKIDDHKWVDTQQHQLDFGNLNQGRYDITFRYKDNNSDWKYSKIYEFIIIYPWYSQSWFYFLIITIVSLIIVTIVIQLLKKSIKKNKTLQQTISEREKLRTELNTVRKNVAQDFHDELGNKLASISVLSNLVMQKTNTATDLHQKVKKIKEDSKSLYSGMRDFIWALDHESDRLDELQLYLTDFGEQLFNNTEISFLSSSPIDTTNIILPYYWSKQLVFIFKEAMTNCIKHSNAQKVSLSFEINQQTLLITLNDNGQGFSIDTIKRQNGLINMESRAEKINSKLYINSSDIGTTIIFKGNF